MSYDCEAEAQCQNHNKHWSFCFFYLHCIVGMCWIRTVIVQTDAVNRRARTTAPEPIFVRDCIESAIVGSKEEVQWMTGRSARLSIVLNDNIDFCWCDVWLQLGSRRVEQFWWVSVKYFRTIISLKNSDNSISCFMKQLNIVQYLDHCDNHKISSLYGISNFVLILWQFFVLTRKLHLLT